VTGQAPGHVSFEELAAGYVLDILEPADERRFVRHAGRGPRCQQALTDHQEVAEALAEAVPAVEPGEELGQRILAAGLNARR
jgi:anti-sigma-K factor RskA